MNQLCQDQWIEDWAMLARRYQNWPHVGGFDLRNEVGGGRHTRGPETARQFPPGLSLWSGANTIGILFIPLPTCHKAFPASSMVMATPNMWVFTHDVSCPHWRTPILIEWFPFQHDSISFCPWAATLLCNNYPSSILGKPSQHPCQLSCLAVQGEILRLVGWTGDWWSLTEKPWHNSRRKWF